MVIIQVEKKDNYAKIENLHNNDLLTKLEETTINEGVFVEIRIHVGLSLIHISEPTRPY